MSIAEDILLLRISMAWVQYYNRHGLRCGQKCNHDFPHKSGDDFKDWVDEERLVDAAIQAGDRVFNS